MKRKNITATVAGIVKAVGAEKLDRYDVYEYTTQTPGVTRIGLLLRHDYDGTYPTRDVLFTHDLIRKAAARRGLRCEQRGNYTGTLVYLD